MRVMELSSGGEGVRALEGRVGVDLLVCRLPLGVGHGSYPILIEIIAQGQDEVGRGGLPP